MRDRPSAEYFLSLIELGLGMEDGSDGLRGSRMADRLEMSTRPLVNIA